MSIYMKKQLKITFIFLFTAGLLVAFGQEECKVLVPELAGTYKGKCKKGLANEKGKAVGIDTYEGQFLKGLPDGKGTYYYANGDVYEGEWLFGMRDGIGILTSKYDEKDSVVAGLWQQDEYKGPVPARPKVNYMTGVDRYTFLKYGNIQNKVMINILQNGRTNTTIEGFRIISNSGVTAKSGTEVGFDYIVFPVTIKVNYVTYNKMQTNKYQVIFEFTISEPGEWQVTIYN